MDGPVTVDELVSQIQHSDLPSVAVEGKTDAAFYRKLESLLGTTTANFLICGSRGQLLEVYRRRGEFSAKRVCFVADKDMWIFTGIPDEFAEVIFSEGYSIENDFYSDSDIERLLNEEPTRQNHRTMIQEVARWFAWEVEKCLNGQEYRVQPPNLYLLIPLSNFTCCPNYLAALGFVAPSQAIYDDVATHYKLKLQGHLLYKVLTRFFTPPETSRINTQGLVNISLAYAQNGALTTRILQAICGRFGIQMSGQIPLNIAA